MSSGRVRIRINQLDGTCPGDAEDCVACTDNLPIPRGKDVKISIVNDDGTETPLRNVRRMVIRANGRTSPVSVILELTNPIFDITVPGDFLGEDRTRL